MPTFAEQMSQVAYKRSADVNDPKNANADWRAGYAVGYGEDIESMTAIAREWEDRGRPSGKTDGPFIEWKIGFWAGRFTKIDERRAATTPAVVACKVETGSATDVSRTGTGKRADAHQPESGTPINPPLSDE